MAAAVEVEAVGVAADAELPVNRLPTSDPDCSSWAGSGRRSRDIDHLVPPRSRGLCRSRGGLPHAAVSYYVIFQRSSFQVLVENHGLRAPGLSRTRFLLRGSGQL